MSVVVRVGVIVGVLCALRGSARATPNVIATCNEHGCLVLEPPAHGTVHLIVRLREPAAAIPKLELRGKPVSVRRCGSDFCRDVDASDLNSAVIDGQRLKIAHLPPNVPVVVVPGTFAPVSTWLTDGIGASWRVQMNGDAPPAPRPIGKPPTRPVTVPASVGPSSITSGVPHLETRQHEVASPPENGEPVHQPSSAGGEVGVRLNGEPVIAPRPTVLDDLSVPEVLAIGTGDALDCSAVAITPRFLLTARHCASATRAVYGATVDQPLAEFAIDRADVPPDGDVDIALLHTTEAMEIGLHPRRNSKDRGPPFGQVRVVGFGISNFANRTGFGIKRQMFVAVQGWGCDGARPTTTGCIAGTEMVLPPDRAHDTCNGDSGGGVFEPAGKSWRLLAITSRAVAGTSDVCGSGGIYVRVDAAAEWIDRVIGEGP